MFSARTVSKHGFMASGMTRRSERQEILKENDSRRIMQGLSEKKEGVRFQYGEAPKNDVFGKLQIFGHQLIFFSLRGGSKSRVLRSVDS